MKRLSKTEFKATFGNPMTRQREKAEPPFDFWPYVNSLPKEEFGKFDFSDGQVDYAYRDASGRYEHVLVNCEDKNVFLVLVLDLETRDVYGHRVLNLNEEYALTEMRTPEPPMGDATSHD